MDETYKAALDLWGAEAQTLMAMEEMAELQKELCKRARGKDNREEIADVRIMLDQMAILHNCEELAGKFKEQKIERLRKLIRRKKGAEKGLSNADRIRAMSDEELAEFISQVAYGRETPWCKPFDDKFCKNCPTTKCEVEGYSNPMDLHECDFEDGKCPHGSDIVWWLQQPAEEEQL